jgi:putative heme iron utilization protein
MTTSNTQSAANPGRESKENQASQYGAQARDLVRMARKAYLGTLDKASGHPHVSLVTVATEPDGVPVLLISRLAVHTQNLLADQRCSLLFDGTDLKGDPLAGGRVTLIGRGEITTSTVARQRFLARHPEATGYADFPDFAFYRLVVERAHYIGGFGRITTLPASEVLTDVSNAEALIAGEGGIVEHMNADHGDAVQLYATVLAGAPAGDWRMTGIDPEGLDMAEAASGRCARLNFEARIASPGDARRELVRLVGVARASGTG